jgi:hypothetical protein
MLGDSVSIVKELTQSLKYALARFCDKNKSETQKWFRPQE